MTKEKMKTMRKACNRVSCKGCEMFQECKRIKPKKYPLYWTDAQIEKYGE